MIMCVLLCYPVSFHMLQLFLTGHPVSSSLLVDAFLPYLVLLYLMSGKIFPHTCI